jgi:hypothetical protein
MEDARLVHAALGHQKMEVLGRAPPAGPGLPLTHGSALPLKILSDETANWEAHAQNRPEDELAENARITATFPEGGRSLPATEALKPLNPGQKNL